MNIPNFLTVMRILLIPLLVILIIDDNLRGALLVFMIAGASDAADGFIARYFNQKTEFGAYIDPIADKLLLCTSYVTLAILHQVPAWLTVLVVSRDIIILAGIGLLLLTDKRVHIAPSMDSKVTTLMQLLTVLYIFLEEVFSLTPLPKTYLFFLTALVTLFSGLHYVFIGFRILGGQQDRTQ